MSDTTPMPAAPTAQAASPSSLPPKSVWLAFGLVAVLRTLPFLSTLIPPDGNGTLAFLPTGYLPGDWMAYIGMFRQAANTGRFALDNPFTTEPQDGRFVLIFHWVLGQLSGLTHINPFWVLELSRLPLLAIFACVLWRFITPILPDARHRVWACWLIALSGGFDFLIRMMSTVLPKTIASRTLYDLWHVDGWTTFESCFNPLWITALILVLVTLQPLLKPGGPRGIRDALQSGLSFFCLYYTHPYSGLAIAPILAFYFALRLIFGDTDVWRELIRSAVILLPAAIAIAAISAWQNQDPVYKLSAAGVIGARELPVFWYPVSLGLLCVFGLLGWQRLIAAMHPWRFALGGWSLATIFLHTCPLINGYKFAFLLYIPLCIAAAPSVSDTFSNLWLARKPIAIVLATMLFAGNLQLTWYCLDEARLPYPRGSMVTTDYLRVCAILAEEPEGYVLSSAKLGNLIPAYSRDRVYVGQWFMTLDYEKKSDQYDQLVKYLDIPQRSPEADESFRRILADNHIRYFVTPTRTAAKTRDILGSALVRELSAGALCILEVK